MQEAQHRNSSDDRLLDVVVVGGSQAGLAMAWHLAQRGLRFVVLEAAPQLGHTWRSHWDSLTLFTPAQYDALPGMAFPAPADTYPTKDPVADYLQAYAKASHLPVRLNARVTKLRRVGEEFEIHTADEAFHARQVVVATGPFHVPFIPPATRLDESVTQLHSANYRNPQALPDGPVLVVDGGSLEVGVVVWATGYRSDYTWIDIPGVLADGRVLHRHGVSDVPGLYFLGLSWQHTRGSALLGFVNDAAAWLADRIAQQHAATAAQAGAHHPPG